MEELLKKQLLEKCRKQFGFTEEDNYESQEIDGNFTQERDVRLDGKSKWGNILAEERRKYSARKELVYLMFHDMLEFFFLEWDGQIIRKLSTPVIEKDSEEEEHISPHLKGAMNENHSTSDVSWKLLLPDEYVNVKLFNGNTYSGHVSRKMMEDEGVYTWTNSFKYKGQFEENCIRGHGVFEWVNDVRYEGDFLDGYRHGKGIMTDMKNNFLYNGEWYTGKKHGKGYCHYADNDSYNGDWVMGKMEGFGLRIYPTGARYVGQWRCGVRHGIGTMIWANRDVYHGEWRCGDMNGYGEYAWNSFFNKTLCWPQEAFYAGNWKCGMRHGKGTLKLNTMGGARYSGCWKDNKKHGEGVIIVRLLEESVKVTEAKLTPISVPEHFLNFSYHISRFESTKAMFPVKSNDSSDATYEKYWLYNCLTMHMTRLRNIYNDYAKLFANTAPKCNFVMVRLCLWQLWRDCGIHKREYSLVEIDENIAKNNTAFIEDPYYAFETITMPQFIHALLEVSWHLYTKRNFIRNAKTDQINGKLAGGLHKLLTTDIYPKIGRHTGNLCKKNWDLLPIYGVYELYQNTGYPPSVRTALRDTCTIKATLTTTSFDTLPKNVSNGFNCVGIFGRISYLTTLQESELQQEVLDSSVPRYNKTVCGLYTLRKLGPSRMLNIMARLCPIIKDPDNDMVINVDYQLTFLEFYEIILEATKQSFCLKEDTENLIKKKRNLP